MSVSRSWPIVLESATDRDSRLLREFAEFWKVPYQFTTRNEGGSLVFTTQATHLPHGDEDTTIVVSPSCREDVDKVVREYGLETSSKICLIHLPVGPSVKVSLRTEVHEFSGSRVEPVLRAGEVTILSKIRGTRVYLLSVDLLGEYSKRIYGGIEERPSKRFWLASKLPFSYQTIPRFIRDRSFRSGQGLAEITEEKLSPVECLRTIFLASLVIVCGPIPKIGFWRKGKSCALVVTHDVETLAGLQMGAQTLLRVERNLAIRSTWNIPSDRYPLSSQAVRDLRDSGEIGGHDTLHDGRLSFLDMKAKAQRLRDCRERLERLIEHPVHGFRAPLLQHSSELVAAVATAGYRYDSSCPSWEILSPTSMRPHGVGSIFPFEVANILEIPVSLPQDHQLMRVAGEKPPAAVDLLLRLSRWIQGLGGPCVLLVHPDYELGMVEWESEYRRLLEHFASDPSCDIMTLGEMSDWWRYRARAQWIATEANPSIVSPDGGARGMELQAELVTAYGSGGFTIERLPS
jgi:hypothetical protein